MALKHRKKICVERVPFFFLWRAVIQRHITSTTDFYSGFVYEMLDIPQEMYTSIFAIARIAGWSAHRIEELVTGRRIIRPAYMSVMEELS